MSDFNDSTNPNSPYYDSDNPNQYVKLRGFDMIMDHISAYYWYLAQQASTNGKYCQEDEYMKISKSYM